MAWILRLIVVTVLLIVAQALFFRKMGLTAVKCARGFSSRFSYAGDEIVMWEEITNSRPVPVPLLVLESRIDKALGLSSAVDLEANQSNYHKSVFSMLPFSKIVRKHKVKLLKRGYFEMKFVTVSAYDLLGFSKVSDNEMPVNAVVTVYPSFLNLEEMKFPSHSFLGDTVVRRWIIDDPFINAGVREYQPTDPMKQINWSATARTGTLQVNQHDFTSNTKLLILLNIDTSEHQWNAPTDSALLENAISLCATIAKYAIEKGMEVGFSSNGQSTLKKGSYTETTISSGEQHLYVLLEEMALLDPSRLTSFHYFLNTLSKSGLGKTDILIVTAFVDEKIDDEIALLRASGNAVEVLDLKEVNGYAAG
ncbi:MAG: DUF58 domain-containing protein [Clostridia bacterium]|nr:DUF58 domain-containing protein [Clostridia bacterium]